MYQKLRSDRIFLCTYCENVHFHVIKIMAHVLQLLSWQSYRCSLLLHHETDSKFWNKNTCTQLNVYIQKLQSLIPYFPQRTMLCIVFSIKEGNWWCNESLGYECHLLHEVRQCGFCSGILFHWRLAVTYNVYMPLYHGTWNRGCTFNQKHLTSCTSWPIKWK